MAAIQDLELNIGGFWSGIEAPAYLAVKAALPTFLVTPRLDVARARGRRDRGLKLSHSPPLDRKDRIMDHADTTGQTLPILHMNGTSRGALLQQRCDAGKAVRVARSALADMEPNPRDYYTNPGRYERAMAQYRSRATMLGDLLQDLQAEAEAIADMDGGRP